MTRVTRRCAARRSSPLALRAAREVWATNVPECVVLQFALASMEGARDERELRAPAQAVGHELGDFHVEPDDATGSKGSAST